MILKASPLFKLLREIQTVWETRVSAHTRQEASERDDGGVLVIDRGVALEMWSETKPQLWGWTACGREERTDSTMIAWSLT